VSADRWGDAVPTLAEQVLGAPPSDIPDVAFGKGLPDAAPDSFPCPVPGCDYVAIGSVNKLGPHIAAHRSKAKQLAPRDVADGVLNLLYPESIPTHRLRDVAAWVEATDRLAIEAMADQVEEPPA
jgi:hypothetical protein